MFLSVRMLQLQVCGVVLGSGTLTVIPCMGGPCVHRFVKSGVCSIMLYAQSFRLK